MSSLSGKEIAEIARLLDESNFSSLDLTQGEFRLRISRDGASDNGSERYYEPAEDTAPAQLESTAPQAGPASASPSALGPAQTSAGAGEEDVIAPLLGNYYASPRPGEPPFVQVGDQVTPDTTIAIIEVMKLMNPIRAGVSGTITAMLAENGSSVEENQPLIRVKVG